MTVCSMFCVSVKDLKSIAVERPSQVRLQHMEVAFNCALCL